MISSSSSSLKDIIHNTLLHDIEALHSERLHTLTAKRVKLAASNYAFSIRNKAQSFVDFNDTVQELQYSKSRTPYCLITINPKPEVTLTQLQDAVNALIPNYFTWSIHTFEIRKAPDLGLHAHLLGYILPSKQTPNFSRIKNSLVPTLCGNTKHVDIKYVPQHELENTYSYITKTKVAKSKKAANDATITWRSSNDLPTTYTSGDTPTCLSPPTIELII